MATELSKFTDAYATMVVATYEPLILKWYSGTSICAIANSLSPRLSGLKMMEKKKLGTAQYLTANIQRKVLPDLRETEFKPAAEAPERVTRMLSSNRSVQKVDIKGYPNAEMADGKVFLHGVLQVESDSQEDKTSIPLVFNKNFSRQDDLKIEPSFKKTFAQILSAVEKTLENDGDLYKNMSDSLYNMGNTGIYHFFPPKRLHEALSPIGIAHFYRQYYFNVEEGVGPIEQAFTVAPLETLEVVYQTVMRRIFEETVETGMESVTETQTEEKNMEEISDKVSSMIQRDTSASMSANASGSIGVWQVGASASADFSTSSQRSREETSKRLKETTKRASERITKSFSVRTKETNDFSASNFQRRVIQNNSPAPVSYGLRRVLRKVLVKVQDLGPRLVWQLYVPNPGKGLARSKFIQFRDSDPIAIPDIPPGVRPRPQGGTDSGSTGSEIGWEPGRRVYFVTLVIPCGADREIKAVSIDNITDLEGGGKNDLAPSPSNGQQWGGTFNGANNTYSVNIAITPGDSASVSVSYTYSWLPSAATIAAWQNEVNAARNVLTQAALNEQFERQKLLITQKSKIQHRPPNDLRKEERFEVMNRMISMLFAQGIDNSQPSPLEIEYFHRFFDLEGMFVNSHPSWWRPRYSTGGTGLNRPPYEITLESDPAPLGSSLGWAIQLDGDDRRNEFLNSPWVRVCMPIKPGIEKEAIEWLAKHIEGEYGYDPSSGALKSLLESIAAFRTNENSIGVEGPNYVNVSSTVGAPENPLSPQGIYPIVDEFEAIIPTEGFVYDELKLVQP